MNTASPFQPGAAVACYLRDSGGEEQELSVEQQESAVRAWCRQHQITLTNIYRDLAAKGSSTIGREAFHAMIDHFRRPPVVEQGVIIWKYSRFAREIDDAAFYKADLRRRGFIIQSMNDNVPDGLEGRLIESAIDFMNARFLEDLSTDVRRGQRHLLERYGALGGTPPRGFMRLPITLPPHRDGSPHIVHRWVPDPAWWEICRQAWSLRASGVHLSAIHDQFHIYNAISSYATFFRNRLYLGELCFSDLIITHYVEPMIDQRTWDAVQALNANPPSPMKIQNHPRRLASSYVLSGMVYCARCGRPLVGETIKFGDGKTYNYYACSGAHRRRDCLAKKISASVLENEIFRAASDLITSQMFQAGQQARQDERADLERLHQVQLTRLRAMRTNIRRNITHLVNVIADNGGSKALHDRLIEMEATEESLSRQIDALLTPEKPGAAPAGTTPDVAIKAIATPKQKSLLLGLLEKVYAVVNTKRLKITLNLRPFSIDESSDSV